MTDLEKFVELYKSVGIDVNVHGVNDHLRDPLICRSKIILEVATYGSGDDKRGYTEGSTLSDKLDGYAGFYTEILFDKDGKFIKQNIYE